MAANYHYCDLLASVGDRHDDPSDQRDKRARNQPSDDPSNQQNHWAIASDAKEQKSLESPGGLSSE